MKDKIFSFIGNGSLHLGWAIYGQECDCGTPPSFNWLAKLMPEDDMDLSDEAFERSIRFKIGSFFIDLSNKFDTYL
jgi:hypothetical protein